MPVTGEIAKSLERRGCTTSGNFTDSYLAVTAEDYRIIMVDSTKERYPFRSATKHIWLGCFGHGSLLWVSLIAILFYSPLAHGQSPQSDPVSGSIRGSVVDRTGTAIAGARVILIPASPAPATPPPALPSSNQELLTDEDGQFLFANIAPGSFQLTITSTGFAAQTTSGVLHSGEACVVPQIGLVLATEVTEVRVELSPIELAQEQLKDEEKQRVLGIIPNFYVSYVPNAAPLNTKQKFQLAWKATVDPVSFVLTGAVAGIEQAQNDFSGYGQGAQGYAKRYGASYADLVASDFIGGAILPSLLKQDPRYFYKGTGSKRSRFLYAVANAVICKGDNGHWQTNYSNIFGNIAAGGISTLYYPAGDHGAAALAFENAAIGIGVSAAANVLQEFII